MRQDPKLLYAVKGVSAYHIANGKEESLTPNGAQTLSLLMVPTSSVFADPAQVDTAGAPEEDFYLHLHLPPELDLPLPATTQIYHQPPTSYLIPRWDLGPDSGAFTRIEFPAIGSRKGIQEDVDTFETILAQCTAFLERAPPPRTGRGEKSSSVYEKSARNGGSSKAKAAAADGLPAYNPADYKPGEGYVQGSHSSHTGGQIVLVDEEDGSVIGELAEGFEVVEDSDLKHGSKGRSFLGPQGRRVACKTDDETWCRSRRDFPSADGGKIRRWLPHPASSVMRSYTRRTSHLSWCPTRRRLRG